VLIVRSSSRLYHRRGFDMTIALQPGPGLSDGERVPLLAPANDSGFGAEGGCSGGSADDAELTLAQLLCTRLCHDLIGPTAAIGAGEELIREDGAEDPEAHDLIADSARQLAGRLAFFRMVFGHGDPIKRASLAGAVTLAETWALADGFLLGGRVRRVPAADSFDAPADVLSCTQARLLLNLIMVGCDALPRGGRVQVDVTRLGQELRLMATMSGPVARLADDLGNALRTGDAASATPRTIHAVYLGRRARQCGANIEFVADAGAAALRLLVVVPTALRAAA
jgi:histidine phosphotransferase ChpT